MTQIKSLNSKNIFLFDAAGALLSLILTAGILPLFSVALGISKNTLYFLAIFPFTYGIYSFFCYRAPQRKEWMLRFIILANILYIFVSFGVIIATTDITLLGLLFLSAEILVLIGVILIEWSILQKDFPKKS
jgi:hypothetical protein